MAKVSLEDKNQYYDKIRPYREILRALLENEQKILAAVKKDNTRAGYVRIDLSGEMINLASHYIIMNGISQSMLKLRNEEALNDGRKSLYKAVIYLEEVVGNFVDAPYSDYEDKLEAITSFEPAKRYLLMRRLGFAIRLLELAYGDNTKWRWAFVDLEGRYAAVVKNMLNLRNAVANTDPRSPHYEPVLYHLKLVKKLLMQAADRYREKYELSTNRIDDFKMGINFLHSLRRLHNILGDREDSEIVRKKSEIWSAKLELDIKKIDEAAKKTGAEK